MEKSRKKSKLSKIYYIILISILLFVVSLLVTRNVLENEKKNEENQIENVVSNDKKEIVQVPRFAGKTFEEAKEEAEKVNLKLEKIETKHWAVEKGYIIKQAPEYNTPIEEGETVKVYVSIGE